MWVIPLTPVQSLTSRPITATFTLQEKQIPDPDFFLPRFVFVHISGGSDGHQPAGVDPNQVAVSETVVQRTDRLHPHCGGGRRLAVPVEGSGTHPAPRRALLCHVLVQLRQGEEVAVWTTKHQRAHVQHRLHRRSSVWFCERSPWTNPTDNFDVLPRKNCLLILVCLLQIAAVVTLPFDVVKTRRQVELGELQAKNCNYDIKSLSPF